MYPNSNPVTPKSNKWGVWGWGFERLK
jgi:hypothetical protein